MAGRRGSKLQAADGGREEGIGYRTERVGETWTETPDDNCPRQHRWCICLRLFGGLKVWYLWSSNFKKSDLSRRPEPPETIIEVSHHQLGSKCPSLSPGTVTYAGTLSVKIPLKIQSLHLLWPHINHPRARCHWCQQHRPLSQRFLLDGAFSAPPPPSPLFTLASALGVTWLLGASVGDAYKSHSLLGYIALSINLVSKLSWSFLNTSLCECVHVFSVVVVVAWCSAFEK